MLVCTWEEVRRPWLFFETTVALRELVALNSPLSFSLHLFSMLISQSLFFSAAFQLGFLNFHSCSRLLREKLGPKNYICPRTAWLIAPSARRIESESITFQFCRQSKAVAHVFFRVH